MVNSRRHAPVAQLDRVLPSEGRGRTFESSRARQATPSDLMVVPVLRLPAKKSARYGKVPKKMEWLP
jgi:hypothetical protein